MADFLETRWRTTRKGIEVYPSFVVKSRSNDLMIRGRDFYAVWDEETGLWSMDEDDVISQVDGALDILAKEKIDKINAKGEKDGTPVDEREKVYILKMRDSDSGVIDKWHKYVQRQMRDHYHALDEKIIFSNQKTKKTDYASKRLSYAIGEGDISAYDELMNTLYDPSERVKLEWAIGAIISGDAKRIQKFIVMYGSPGSGKSTVLNIIQDLFEDYVSIFDAKELASSNNSFALESFNSNPLVSIQHDGDLSRIEDNTRLNSIVSHETMVVNEKFKSKYNAKFNTFLFMGTNRPVQITESKSGLTRRLIDVYPSERRLPRSKYNKLVKDIKFELGAIAQHCLDVYNEMGENYYDSYIPERMIKATNPIYDFIDYNYLELSLEEGFSLKELWKSYSDYIDIAKIRNPLKRNIFADEMRNYFSEYYDQIRDSNGVHVRSYYKGFLKEKFEKDSGIKKEVIDIPKKEGWLKFDFESSIFDEARGECYAQLANLEGTPTYKWENVKTHLCDIDTKELHYVKIPEEEIVIDFDIKDNNGNKSYEKNLEAASKFPPTYAELSKSGSGIHLHYLYSGDVNKLSRIYGDDIEIKVFTGNSSLRRKLTKCNDIPIAIISSGLPLKGEKNVINFEAAKSERALRERIKRCLNKEHHGATAPEVNFILKILDDAYESGLDYDITDMRPAVLAFASNSTNQSDKCIKQVLKMHFMSKNNEEKVEELSEYTDDKFDEEKFVFYDVEVFPNLFICNWKTRGSKNVSRMINPSPSDIKKLVTYPLVGFNNRRYDNHIIYARMQGYSNEELFRLSQRIIEGSKNAFFGAAYNLSVTDIYDFCAKKQSLKKWEIELGIHHQELGLRWDEPVPEDLWVKVAEYCDNDVIATEAVFEANQADWTARKILADIAGMSVNSTTNSLTTKIIFGGDKKPDLIYTDLKTGDQFDREGNKVISSDPSTINAFPGYEYVYNEKDKKWHNMFMETDVGHGGYVYAEPGMYTNVALLDVASMHPTSAINLNIFGEYTKNFKDILDARLYIKHKDYESAEKLFDGKLKKYLNDAGMAKSLSQALKIAINSVYGLTSAKFDNPFRDIRNKNNIVALRGALFMRLLQEEVKKRGFTVAHIKTDSIKIPNATNDIIHFVTEFGHKYGYNFEHEATYKKICLVNDSVYIAQYDNGEWTATGAQFAVPYVFKKLFSKEELIFKDFCETKTVSSALYLDMNEDLPDVKMAEKELEKVNKKISDITESNYGDSIDLVARQKDLLDEIQKGHNYIFIGKAGLFCPIKPGCGGGELLRETAPGKYAYANDSKGYRWLESELVQQLNKESDIDETYYEELANSAIDDISEFGDFYWFASNDQFIDISDNTPTF